MKSKIYTEGDGDVSYLKEKTIAIIGYGNQGRAQALNLRDTGLTVIIGNRLDEYQKRAQEDGFATFSISEAVKQANIIFLLLPDEIIPVVFNKEILPNIQDNSSLVFAHGYAITFNTISSPCNINILLIAPRMIGQGVRENYLTGQGFYSFIAIHLDATGDAQKILLALCEGLGTLRKGAIELTFKQETILDLFNEQAFGPAFGRVLLSSIYTLIDAGYPPEAVLIEMYLSGEMEYTYQKFRKIGLVEQVNLHSHTSQYGAMSRGINFMNLPIKKIQKKILNNLEDGSFAREWNNPLTKLKFKFLKFFATRTKIYQLEKEVRANLSLPKYDLFDEDVITKENNKIPNDIKKQLSEFEKYFKEL